MGDPFWQSSNAAYDFLAKTGEDRTRLRAGSALANRDYGGAASILARGGDLAASQVATNYGQQQATLARTQEDADRERHAKLALDTASTIGRFIQARKGSITAATPQDYMDARQAIDPWLRQQIRDPQEIADFDRAYAQDPKGTLDAYTAAAKRALKIIPGKDGSYTVANEDTGEFVGGYEAPSSGVITALNPNAGWVETPAAPGRVLGPNGSVPAAAGAPPDANAPPPPPAGAAPASPAMHATAGATTGTAQPQSGSLDPRQFFKQFVLPHEGGLNPSDANGSPTFAGINQAANPGVDVRHMTNAQAADIFTNKYFRQSGAANLPPALAAVHADTYFINPAKAQQLLQRSGGDPNAYMAGREAWMANLVQRQPERFAKYDRAWSTRNADLRAYAANVGGGAQTAQADTTYTTPGGRIVHPGTPSAGNAPTGYRFLPDGSLEPIPGGPAAPGGGDDATAGLSGDDLLKAVGPARAALIRMVAEGRARPQDVTSLKGGERERFMQQVAQYDPTFDVSRQGARAATRKDFADGKAAQNITAINTLSGHLNDLDHKIDALQNMGFRPGNKFANWYKQNMGNTALVDFQTTKEAVANDMTRVLLGTSGNVFDREGWQKRIDEANSPDQLRTVVRGLVDVLNPRIEALSQQYNAGMGVQAEPLVLLKPQAAYALSRLQGGGEQANTMAAAKAGFYARWNQTRKPLNQVDDAWAAYAAKRFGGDPTTQGRGPAVGSVEGGYRFRGGDPSQPSSWVKVQ